MMTLEQAAEQARCEARGPGIVYVTHTNARGYQVERFNVRRRNAVQAWAQGRRIDLDHLGWQFEFDTVTESPKGSIK